MLGIILTGHGHFATGLQSSIELIAGKQEKMKAIDFEEGMSSDNLREKLSQAIDDLNTEKGTIIFTDIPGGTPFNQSVMLSTQNELIKVVSGSNMPAIMDGLFSRETEASVFVEKVLRAGKDGLVTYQEKKATESIEEDGI